MACSFCYRFSFNLFVCFFFFLNLIHAAGDIIRAKTLFVMPAKHSMKSFLHLVCNPKYPLHPANFNPLPSSSLPQSVPLAAPFQHYHGFFFCNHTPRPAHPSTLYVTPRYFDSKILLSNIIFFPKNPCFFFFKITRTTHELKNTKAWETTHVSKLLK